MGWQDRDYARDEVYRRTVRRRMSLPASWTLCKTLITINVAVFILDKLTEPPGDFGPIFRWGAMFTPDVMHGQVWRLITSQYLHLGVWHLFFNMLGLYFLGRYLENAWGQRKFFVFYTSCGLAGNLFLMLLNLLGWLAVRPAIGASGCILGVLGACAVLFPGIQLIVMFFPMAIRTAAALFLGLYVLNLLQRGYNAGGDAAHLAGMVAGAAYAYWLKGGFGRLPSMPRRPVWVPGPRGSWQHKLEKEQKLDEGIDRILGKIREKGIASLTETEKRTLAKASKRQQEEDERLGRVDKL